jgi:hypothetical protein
LWKQPLSLITELTLLTTLTGLFLALRAKSPLLLALLTLMTTASLSILVIAITNKWISYAILLVFLGGIMVVFVYSTSLSGNSKLPPSHAKPLSLPIIVVIFMVTIAHPQSSKTSIFSSLYSPSVFAASSALAIILILGLIVCVKTTESFKGALIKHYT